MADGQPLLQERPDLGRIPLEGGPLRDDEPPVRADQVPALVVLLHPLEFAIGVENRAAHQKTGT